MKINPKNDSFPVYPAGRYGSGEGAMLDRLFVAESRFAMRDDDGKDVVDEDGNVVHPEVVIAKVSFDYINSKGAKERGSMTQEYGRGIAKLYNALGGEFEKLPADAEGDVDLPTDDQSTVLINGACVEGWDVEFRIETKTRGDRRFNNIAGLKLAK